MVRKVLPLGMIMLFLLASGAWCAVTPLEFLYNGNIDPEQPNSAGPGLRFVNQKNVDGTVIYDPAAIDGMALQIADNFDTGCNSGDRSVYALDAGINTGTIVGRFRVLSDTHVSADCPPGNPQADVAAGNMSIVMPITASPYKWGNSACMHYGGASGDLRDTWRHQSTTVTGDSGYHIFRMTIQGFIGGLPEPWNDDFEAYATNSTDPAFNERGKLTGQGFWTGDYVGGMDATPALLWGLTVVDDGPPHNKCVALVASGVAGETFGSSIPALVAPDATTKQMVVEFDIKGDITSSLQRWQVAVADIFGANIAQVQGYANNCRMRINGGAADNYRNLTGGTTWDHLKLVIDTTPDINGKKYAKFYLNGVIDPLTPNGLDYTQANPTRVADMIGEVSLSSEYTTGRYIMYFDNFHAEGDPVTPAMITAAGSSARTVKVYMDENPVPVLVNETAMSVDSLNDLGREGFMFGTDDTLARQIVCFDWVSGSNQGAFPPGVNVTPLGHILVPTALTQPMATTIDGAKTNADVTSVVIPEAVVATAYTDNFDQPWFFGIEKSDRSAGMRVLSTYGAIPGEKVSIHGVLTTTTDGERVIQAMDVTQVDLGPFDIPTALYMSNKASGGAAFGAQGMVRSYNTDPWNFDGFAYPDGALPGNGTWTGTMPASVLAVQGGALKFMRGNVFDAVSNITWDESATTYKVSFNAKLGDGATGTNNYWRMILKSNETLHREIGRWEGYRDKVIPQRVNEGVTTIGPDQPLGAGYKKFTIEFTPSKVPDQPDGDHSNVVNFLVDDVSVWTHTFYSGPTTSPRYPYSITLQSQNRSPAAGTYVWLDDFALENVLFPLPPNVPSVGLNNVGLLVRLYGKVTESYFDMLAPSYDTSYFYLDDGSGLLGESPHVGVRCSAKNQMFFPPQDVPAVNSYVSAYGILGMRNGQRYLYTLGYDTY